MNSLVGDSIIAHFVRKYGADLDSKLTAGQRQLAVMLSYARPSLPGDVLFVLEG